MTEVAWHSLRRTVAKAAVGGAKRRSMTEWEWDVAGDCEEPHVQAMWARKPPELVERDRYRAAKARWSANEAAKILVDDFSWEPPPVHPSRQKSYSVDGIASQMMQLTLHVRCRKCAKCRKVRSRMWYARALLETEQAQRTWFGTITFSEQNHFLSLARARRDGTRRGVVWEELTPDEQFARVDKQNAVHLQLWLKRVRKQSKASLRYLLVCEAHKSGLPHYHCLVHEQRGSARVSWRTLAGQWKLGFTNMKLVSDPQQAGYLCKYLSKEARARVRASARYGQRPVAIVEDVKEAPEGCADTLKTPVL